MRYNVGEEARKTSTDVKTWRKNIQSERGEKTLFDWNFTFTMVCNLRSVFSSRKHTIVFIRFFQKKGLIFRAFFKTEI